MFATDFFDHSAELQEYDRDQAQQFWQNCCYVYQKAKELWKHYLWCFAFRSSVQ